MQKKSAINKFCMRVLFKLSKWIPDKWYTKVSHPNK